MEKMEAEIRIKELEGKLGQFQTGNGTENASAPPNTGS